MEGIRNLIQARATAKPNKNLHSEIHVLADEVSAYFGERARFGMYLGVIKRVGAGRARGIWSEVKDSKCDDPRKVFMAKCRKIITDESVPGSKKKPAARKKIPKLMTSKRGKPILNLPALRVSPPPQLHLISSMAVKKITTEGDPILRKRAAAIPVSELGSAKLRQLASDMIETMQKENRGVGLAAPQVGESIRLFVAETADGAIALANPVISRHSRRVLTDEEGCLSVPGAYGMVERAASITVTAYTIDGTKITFDAENMLARIIQHETDHLDGVLFLDRAKGEVKRPRR